MGRKVAILGSSGGNLYNLGGKDPEKLLKEIIIQGNAAGIEIGALQFIGANSTMDNVKETVNAKVFSWNQQKGDMEVICEGSLDEVNKIALNEDEKIAKMIDGGEIEGVILISCDPDKINNNAIKAAAKKKIPVVGTGGTSIAKTQSMGARVIAASGTTGTTNRTRAVAYISALSKEWSLKYRPIIGTQKEGTQVEGSVFSRINFRGIMMSALPGFIAMALILAMSKIPGLKSLEEIFNIILNGLPVIIAAIAAKQVSGLDEVGIVAGIVAGVLSVKGGLIGGLIGGVLAGILAYQLIRLCFSWKFPATTANIVAGGISGLVAGLIVYFLIAPIALKLGDGIRQVIEMALNFSPILAGALAGLLIWPAIIGGAYHAAILPIVLLEMEKTGNSFLGAVDMTGLVMVSAGITLANIISPREKGEAAVAAPGFIINIGFGTFVEAAYPFMFSDKIVFAGALISAAVSGALVGLLGVRGTAYVPSVVAPALSNNPIGFVISMLAALILSFAFTIFANKIHRNKNIGLKMTENLKG